MLKLYTQKNMQLIIRAEFSAYLHNKLTHVISIQKCPTVSPTSHRPSKVTDTLSSHTKG